MAGVVKQIIGSFEDIGKDIARETVKVPIEMIGMGKVKQQTNPVSQQPSPPQEGPKAPVAPRAWLQELAGEKREPVLTVQQRLAKEKSEQDEKQAKKRIEEQKMAPLEKMSTRPKRGNLLGSQRSSEKSKNSRSD